MAARRPMHEAGEVALLGKMMTRKHGVLFAA